MQIPAFSIDLFIILGTALVCLYGAMAGQGALIRETISVYVGIVLASTFAEPLYNYSQQQAGGNYGVSKTIIGLLLLILPILILLLANRHHHIRRHSSLIVTLILAVLAAMLLISSIIAQFDSAAVQTITNESNLASQINSFHLAWLGLVPLAIGASMLFHRSEEKRRRH
ncbi:hypothetical protein EPO04_03755 [Patescibacteria group bacterium]|nr:MAG: hypothetical protein EPO04_03755 [Patescibacteria group bacterium]